MRSIQQEAMVPGDICLLPDSPCAGCTSCLKGVSGAAPSPPHGVFHSLMEKKKWRLFPFVEQFTKFRTTATCGSLGFRGPYYRARRVTCPCTPGPPWRRDLGWGFSVTLQSRCQPGAVAPSSSITAAHRGLWVGLGLLERGFCMRLCHSVGCSAEGPS